MKLSLGRLNFIIMGIAALLILVGFILMGGEPSTQEAFNPDVFSARRVVWAPNLCFAGYLLMIVGIIVKDKKCLAKQEKENSDAEK